MSQSSLKPEHRLFRELQALIRRDNDIFAFIDNAVLDGFWFWDLEHPEEEWMSDSFWITLGYDPATKQHLSSEWQTIINRDDLVIATENLERHCADPSYPYDQVVRYTHAMGHTVWIRCRGMAIRDDTGKPIRMLGAHTDVTALKQQENARLLFEQEQRQVFQKQATLLDELEKSAKIGTWEVDLNTMQVIWSPQTKRIHEVPLDYEPDLSSGINFYKEGESRQAIIEAVEKGINQGKPWDLELQLITATTRTIWVRAIGKPQFEDGKCVRLFGVFQDISQQKAVEAELHASQMNAVTNAMRLQLAHDSVEMGIWEWDLTKDELVWDKWMYTLYGVTEGQFSGAFEAWESAVHPEDIGSAKALLQSAIENDTKYDTQFRVVLPDGQLRHIQANAALIKDDSGSPIKMLGVNYDITERVRTVEILKQAKQKAELAVSAKSDFLANMSHEIRTPMNAILGGLQLLAQDPLNDTQKNILRNAMFSAKSLLTIINDILDYSKIESNKLELEHAPLSLKDVVESVYYDLDVNIKTKGLALNTHYHSGYRDSWKGDVVRLKQILLNIASNAVKFTPQGSVDITLGEQKRGNKTLLLLQVTDTGIGMDEQTCQRIFDRFTQADSSTTRLYGGTGLGMSITQSLVQLMGGELTLNSQPGKGTTVTVLLPLEPIDDNVNAPCDTVTDIPDFTGINILVAEDNAINQAVIDAILAKTGAQVTLVENGQQAINRVRDSHFDLILMDINMPIMDGIQAQQTISKLKPHTPVVALTANVMPEDVSAYLNQGFISHLGKPVDVQALYSLLTRLIRQSPTLPGDS